MKLGISRCLLGEPVRYDRGHKLDRYLRDVLGRYVEWVGVCPEVECGLPVPREAMHLEGDPDAPHLVTIRSHIDHTERMKEWTIGALDQIEKEQLCGFVFKAKSPSSGYTKVKIYNPDTGVAVKTGRGLFAQAFIGRFPLIPVEDEGRLHDDMIRENFIERIFVYDRWRRMEREKPGFASFSNFHTSHKLLIMSHSPGLLKKLGQIMAKTQKKTVKESMEEYLPVLMKALSLEATVKKQVNVLQHIMGYFKKQLSSDEKREVLSEIEKYHNGLSPLVVPLVLLKHYVRFFDEKYLADQWYLHPHPDELKLRNHV